MSYLLEQFRKPERAPLNDLDRCTIVNIFPREFVSVKETIEPGVFYVPGGNIKKPGILVIGSSSWWRYLNEDSPLLEIPTGSLQVANAIVTDYLNGIDGCDMGERKPGLFFIKGELTQKEVLEKHIDKLILADRRQKNWYQELIKMADTLWARTQGNPLAITDDARLAVQELGIKDKPWMKDFSTLDLKHCPACGFLRSEEFPRCPNCKTITDVEKFKKLGLQE